MKSLPVLALLGHCTKEAEAVSLAGYIQMLNESENQLENLSKAKDWDDMLDKTEIFNSKSYSEDSPDGYDSLVNEVVQEEETLA
jgi:hypothetical protein